LTFIYKWCIINLY